MHTELWNQNCKYSEIVRNNVSKRNMLEELAYVYILTFFWIKALSQNEAVKLSQNGVRRRFREENFESLY